MSDIVRSHYIERHSVRSDFFILIVRATFLLTLLLCWFSLEMTLEEGPFRSLPAYIMTLASLYTLSQLFSRTKPSAIVVTMSKEALHLTKYGKHISISWSKILSVTDVDLLIGQPARASGVIVSYQSDNFQNKSILIRDPFHIHRSELASEIRRFGRDVASIE